MEVQLKNLIKHKQKLLFNVKKKRFFFIPKANLLFSDPPKVQTSQSIIAIDNLTTSVRFECEIDSNPNSTILWKFNNKILFNSKKYSIIQNKTFSYLILQQIQLNFDYGYYSCNASNKLGYNATTIQLRSKGNIKSIVILCLLFYRSLSYHIDIYISYCSQDDISRLFL